MATAENISPYLIDAPTVLVESRSKPLCSVPEIGIGNKPIDGGNYLFTEEEMTAFIKDEKASEKWFRPWYGADEFINGRPRYCLWLGDCSAAELSKMPESRKRIAAVAEFRRASRSAPTRALADTPTRFHVENMPDGEFILIPRVSSENRKYIPMGFIKPPVLASDSVHILTNATLYHFGILTSSVHMAWVRTVCGRLKSDYRYSKDIVYNNFPWPDATDKDVQDISKAAQAVLDAREAEFKKDPSTTLAHLYNMPMGCVDLVKAHKVLDREVTKLYGLKQDMSNEKIVGHLFGLYQVKVVEEKAIKRK